MIYIAHRINTVEELKKIPKTYGVEIDLRDLGDRLILQHDPFLDGEDFEDYLKYYEHTIMLLNIKSERIEIRILEVLKKYNVKNYFFLDSSFGMIYLLTEKGEKNFALRFSEFEGLDTIMNMQDRVNWIWVDCFTRLAIDKESYDLLKDAGFKICLTSPELLGRPEDISKYKEYISRQGIVFDAVCTKAHNIGKWLE